MREIIDSRKARALEVAMAEIISRKEAIERGSKRYFPGMRCSRGHISQHLVSNQACVDCISLRKTAAYKQREKIKPMVDKCPLVSPSEARENGLTRYFTGLPCLRGHFAERMTCDNSCTECNRPRHNRRSLEKYRANPEAGRAKGRAYRRNNLHKERVRVAEYNNKIRDLVAVLRKEMPDLLKEFGL